MKPSRPPPRFRESSPGETPAWEKPLVSELETPKLQSIVPWMWHGFLALAFVTGVTLLLWPSARDKSLSAATGSAGGLQELLANREQLRAEALRLERESLQPFLNYLEADSWQARLPWCSEPERIGPLMTDYLADHPDDAGQKVNFLKASFYMPFRDPNNPAGKWGSLCHVDLTDLDKRVPGIGAREGRLFVPMSVTAAGPRVDAEYFHCFAGRLFEWYIAMPRRYPLRCHARLTRAALLDDRASSTDWSCFLVESSSLESLKARAILKKSDPLAAALENATKWDAPTYMVVDLQWATIHKEPELTITRMAAPMWGFVPRELTPEEMRAHRESLGL